jgi:hypothetical protein
MPTAEPLPVEPLDCFQCRQRCEPDGSALFLKIPHPIPLSSGSTTVSLSTSKEQFRIYHPSIDKCRYYDTQTKKWHYKVCHSTSTMNRSSIIIGMSYWEPSHSIYFIVSVLVLRYPSNHLKECQSIGSPTS